MGSFLGMFRGSWGLSIKLFGPVSRSVGVVLSPGNIPAHAGQHQAFESEDSPNRILPDPGDMKKFRGSRAFAQWRISDWGGERGRIRFSQSSGPLSPSSLGGTVRL